MGDQSTEALAILAHELRTPVSTIVAAAAGLERGGEELSAERQRSLVELVASEARRLARLVDDVLTAANLDAGQLPVHPVLTDIGALVARAGEAAQAGAASGRSVTHTVATDAMAQIDPDRLRQVIDNLIDNALRHAGGAVELVVTCDEMRVRIEVNDDGPGIDAAQREAIFEKFQRLESRATGSGLGLWLCQELVNRMNGRLSVTDSRSGGSSFVVELPVSAA
jgi:two-component system sensor histidine kinase BaeS